MASKPPGVLGTASNPGHVPNRTTAGAGLFQGSTQSPPGTLAQLEHKATELAHRISRAIGWNETQSAAYNLVGRQSFTAGVVVGMGENLAKTVVAAVDLLQTLALAEYWESKHDHSFLSQLRSNMFMAISPGTGIGMAVAGRLWPGFDRKAQEAYEERGAIADAIAHAFTHPKEFLKGITKAQEAKAKEFETYLQQKSLSGNFHAGVLMGELLFDLLMVIDLAVGLAKLAMAVPRLARYTEDLARLAREFRVARQLETKAAETVPAGPRLTAAEKEAAQNSMRGSPAKTSRPTPAEAEPEFTKSEKGVYGEAQADTYMDEGGFQKLNGDLVKAGDDPFGKGIDGVWKNTTPPPEYVVTEAKYGTSQLGTLKDGTKQMSDKWVNDRLDKAVGRAVADDIRDADARGQVEKWLLQVDENGNVTKSIIPGD
jgi:hypothetical protein